MIRRDMTPTAVIKRPFGLDIRQESFFSLRQPYVSFDLLNPAYLRAGAKAIVARVTNNSAILYAELPNTTIKISYTGLTKVMVSAAEHIREGFILGLAQGLVKLRVTRASDGEPVAPEFFYEEDKPKIEERPNDDYPYII